MQLNRHALTAVACAFVAFPALAQSDPLADPQPAADEPVFNADADDLLRDLSDYFADLDSFTFSADIMRDAVLTSGHKVTLGGSIWFAVRRPDKLFIELDADSVGKRIWYNGETITLWDRDTNTYAQADAPATIDETLDAISARGVAIPLAHIARSNLYAAVSSGFDAAIHLGDHPVGDTPAEHIAFLSDDLSVQVWIGQESQLVPLRTVITYIQEHTQPQFIATFTDWKLNPILADRLFDPRPPEDAEQIDFLQPAASQEATP